MKKFFYILATGISALALLLGAACFSVQANASGQIWTASPPLHVRGNASSSPATCFVPSQIRQAYGLDQLSLTGAGQTVAIVDAFGSPTIQNDLTVFCNQFNLPPADLTIAYPEGQPARVNSDWAMETSLDVEWVHAIAPGAKILLVVAKSNSTKDLVGAIDYATAQGAQVVSNSWGGGEVANEASYDSHFQHAGIVYVASSGDSGAGVEWPAASPYVLSVGGTSLNLSSNGSYLSETAWSGSGGGTSAYEPRPAYQDIWAGVVGSSRGVPDVAWDADPYTGVAVYDSTPYRKMYGWWQVGGTSFGSPSWSAMIALADQGRKTPLTGTDAITTLYNAAGTTGSNGYSKYFHDITQGSNGYPAQPGYDLVTGIGSPQANNLIPYLERAK